MGDRSSNRQPRFTKPPSIRSRRLTSRNDEVLARSSTADQLPQLSSEMRRGDYNLLTNSPHHGRGGRASSQQNGQQTSSFLRNPLPQRARVRSHHVPFHFDRHLGNSYQHSRVEHPVEMNPRPSRQSVVQLPSLRTSNNHSPISPPVSHTTVRDNSSLSHEYWNPSAEPNNNIPIIPRNHVCGPFMSSHAIPMGAPIASAPLSHCSTSQNSFHMQNYSANSHRTRGYVIPEYVCQRNNYTSGIMPIQYPAALHPANDFELQEVRSSPFVYYYTNHGRILYVNGVSEFIFYQNPLVMHPLNRSLSTQPTELYQLFPTTDCHQLFPTNLFQSSHSHLTSAVNQVDSVSSNQLPSTSPAQLLTLEPTSVSENPLPSTSAFSSYSSARDRPLDLSACSSHSFRGSSLGQFSSSGTYQSVDDTVQGCSSRKWSSTDHTENINPTEDPPSQEITVIEIESRNKRDQNEDEENILICHEKMKKYIDTQNKKDDEDDDRNPGSCHQLSGEAAVSQNIVEKRSLREGNEDTGSSEEKVNEAQ